jgi:arginine repressor
LVGKDEALEPVRDEILAFLKKEGFDIFYSDSSSDLDSLPNIRWQNSKDWKLFFSLAKSQGVKLLVVEERAIE